MAGVVESTLPGRAKEGGRTFTVCTDARFGRDGTGRWAAMDAALGADAWSAYLADGARLRLVARARTGPGTAAHPLRDGVEVIPLPYYVGVPGLLRALPGLVPAVVRAVARADVLVLRLPGAVGLLGALAAMVLRRRYAAEVIGDPAQVLAAGCSARRDGARWASPARSCGGWCAVRWRSST